ncbi:WSC domain-containing protein 1-like isoform X1 [Penaeus japonicus]|uniref:WSC domain-containing protein 1-like isoform X1 n=1 Tax=Penaeus japonicus TaxID=27405 RepID=UPI001C710DF3|nr:WSC domain-containing protein 1-like isoform X1 [Penaeus japonicus]
MELPRNSLRYLLGLILFGILFTLWCGLQGTEHGRLLSTAVSLPLRYLEQQISPRDEFAADETENDWKAMPDERNGPLPPPRWPELDSSMPTNPLWPSDPDCSMYNVSFPLKVRKTFLVSFPRSGNSWTRYLIEGATGLVTGAVFKEKLYHFDMKNDPVKLEGKVILTKIHSNNRRTVPDDVPVILLLRNPAKSIVSYYNFRKARGSDSKWFHNVSYESYFTEDFARHANRQISRWTKLAADRLVYSRRLLVIPYEVLKADPIAQVRRALAFLGIPADEARLACLRHHSQGIALGLQRQADPYTPQQKLVMAEAVANISELLRERNFPPLPAYN